MTNGTKVALGIFGAFILLAGITVMSVVGTNNDFVKAEQGIVAQYKQNQNNYDNYIKKIAEVAQVPAMYRDDLEKVYKSAITGRYGANGSKATFQWLKEQNPTLDSKLYVKIQQIIESGRVSFESDQKMLLDKKRVYQTNLKVFPNTMIAGTLGFPKIDLTKYDIVTSDETEQAFKTKKSKPIKLR
jgi:hypothetical protein